jgi:RimJ/RimL family protein N-acetyltransferase
MVDARALVAEWWPPAAVVVRTPRLELRWPSMDDLIALAAVAADGVHPEDRMPFYTPWTRGSAVERARNVLRWNWKGWGEWDPAKWSFGAVAVVDGVVVGTQGMQATDYAVCRTIETGSWLGLAHQGQGIGKEMRAAMLHLAFAGLDAEAALTGAFSDNEASLGVTRSLGYVENGSKLLSVEGRPARELLFTMDRATWESRRRDDITLEGVEAARPLFGLTDDDPSGSDAPEVEPPEPTG